MMEEIGEIIAMRVFMMRMRRNDGMIVGTSMIAYTATHRNITDEKDRENNTHIPVNQQKQIRPLDLVCIYHMCP